MDFVRKSVSSIGQVAIRLEAAAQKCVEALLELVKLKVSYVVQEAVVVIKVHPAPRAFDGARCRLIQVLLCHQLV